MSDTLLTKREASKRARVSERTFDRVLASSAGPITTRIGARVLIREFGGVLERSNRFETRILVVMDDRGFESVFAELFDDRIAAPLWERALPFETFGAVQSCAYKCHFHGAGTDGDCVCHWVCLSR
jgi:hypothetical protein